MNVIIINSGQKELLQKCISSLMDTVEPLEFDIHIIKEKEYREVTLNTIFKMYGRDDLLIFGDDIIFTDGWFEFLMANRNRGDIIGFSMLYPDTDKVQDTGYDLVSIDNDVSLKPQNRGNKKREIEKFIFRQCDALNGCALYIKKRVIDRIPEVSLEGMNRWGEILYMSEAQKEGFEVIVLGHYLYHYGKSTKVNPNKLLSSESYLLEKQIWNSIVDKYIDRNRIKKHLTRVISDGLKNTIISTKRILFYGAGTVSEFIYEKSQEGLDLNFIDFCSGLQEEEGNAFCDKRILFYKNVQFKNYDTVVITVLQKEEEIFNMIQNYIDKQKVYYVTQETIEDIIKLDIRQLYNTDLVEKC